MTDPDKQTLIKKIDEAIDKGIIYLSQRQFHNGEFLCYIGPDEELRAWCVPESVNYVTAVVGLKLLPFQNRPVVDHMLTKAASFLQSQIMRSSVWNYFTRYHRLFKYSPPDADDTVLSSMLLKARQIPFIDNTSILLSNRTSGGLFYTWFTFHGHLFRHSKSFWRLIARELKSPINNLIFWYRSDLTRNDVDPIVNANVIAYLGYTDLTRSAANYISGLLKNNSEINSDNWYKNPFIYYYFIAQLVPLNIPPIVALKELLIEKIILSIRETPGFFSNDIQLATALSSLLILNSTNKIIDECAEKLLTRQSALGEWKRFGFFTIPTRKFYWGSEELTTVLCMEALNLYNNYLKIKII